MTLDEATVDERTVEENAAPPPAGRWVKTSATGLVNLLVKSYIKRELAWALVAALPDADPPEHIAEPPS